MTLIITAITQSAIVQVSDRRLTWPNGKIYNDNTNKATIISCQDGYFSVAYTGLALIGKKPTGEWLLDFCYEIGAGGLDPSTILTHLEQHAADALRSLAIEQRYKGLTFVLAGIAHEQRFIMTTSNHADAEGMALPQVSDSFLSIGGRLEQSYISVHGSIKAIESTCIRRMTKRREELVRLPGPQIAKQLVSYVRMARRDAKHGKYIGGDCMSVVILPITRSPYSTIRFMLLPTTTCQTS